VWNLNDIENMEIENSNTENKKDSTNFGFSVEKVIVHAEPTNSPNHYNSFTDTSIDADKVLEVNF
jgi:hypothetical protein